MFFARTCSKSGGLAGDSEKVGSPNPYHIIILRCGAVRLSASESKTWQDDFCGLWEWSERKIGIDRQNRIGLRKDLYPLLFGP